MTLSDEGRAPEPPPGGPAALLRGGGIAVWRQIATVLRDEIAGGIHLPGSRLPTEAELARRFGVNRHTLRRAVAALAEEGVLRVEQGRGTFVQPHLLDYEIGPRTRFSEIVARHDRAPAGQLLAAEEVPADAHVAAQLRVPAGTPCLRLESLHSASGAPLSVATNWFPLDRVPNLLAAYAETGSISRALARDGIADYRRRETRIAARPAAPEEAALLRQQAGRPVLVTESVNVDAAGRPVQYAVSRFACDRVQLVVNS